MADFKTKYPSANTVAYTLALASLASDTNLLAGRASTVVDNTTNLDLDHLVSGSITLGSTPTASTNIEIWAFAPISIISGTPAYPDSITGTDANKTMSSRNTMFNGMKCVDVLTADAVANRVVPVVSISIAQLFGSMPPYYGLFVVHNTGVALNATQVALQYTRIQAQSV